MSQTREETIERLMRDVSPEPNSGCWLWVGCIDSKGYGRHSSGRGAYRVLYEAMVGPVPAGLELDHLCRVRACVNPSHLEPVTSEENKRRGVGQGAINAAKTTCAKGHPLKVLGIKKHNGRPERGCRICRTENDRNSARIRAAKRGHWPKRWPSQAASDAEGVLHG